MKKILLVLLVLAFVGCQKANCKMYECCQSTNVKCEKVNAINIQNENKDKCSCIEEF